jgi:predicted AAA+ superfamily ATPase
VLDSGLACHLLGIDTAAELTKSPFLGALFEGFVAAEIAKQQANAGGRRELYYFRDEQGLEVDLVVPRRGGGLSLIECKATKTVTPALAAPLERLAAAVRRKRPRSTVRAFLAHQPSRAGVRTRALTPTVQALPWRELLEEL